MTCNCRHKKNNPISSTLHTLLLHFRKVIVSLSTLLMTIDIIKGLKKKINISNMQENKTQIGQNQSVKALFDLSATVKNHKGFAATLI